ncbi:MFS transporter [Dactylosporangium sp. NPDC000555]|uniref:MFS transporter n=1 Tax=Dactylosporangium sp. NPDC000555 TaxID=3154260 RepID=UPI0033290282
MFTILRKPYAAGLAATNLLVRLAGGAVALALVLFAEATRDSFAAAGLVAGCFAVGTACGAPLTGRLVDRLGATPVLLGTAATHAGALLAIAGLPHAPLGTVAAVAVLAGAARPPVAAWMRGIWVAILDNERDRRASYRFESALLEIGFIAGPLIAGLVAALGRPALGLVLTALIAASATTVFALLPPARTTAQHRPAEAPSPNATTLPAAARPGAASSTTPLPGTASDTTPRVTAPSQTRTRAGGSRDVLGALRSSTIRTLVVSRTALGMTIGAMQVAAAGFAAGQGRAGFAGVLLGGFAVGSLIGSGTLRLRPTVLAALMCVALTPLLLPVGLWWLAALFAVAGAPLAPLNAVAYEVTERAAPAGTATEARMWTSTATMAGTALGTAIAGTVIEHSSARAAVLVAVAGAAAALTVDALGRIGALGNPASHGA